jgi:nicotine blue oxidoreductase
MTIAAIVLAAGEGKRIGGTKALLRIGPETFLARTAAAFARPGIGPVIAVLGCEAERVRSESALPATVVVVENEAWREGMLSSVLLGLEAAQGAGADAVLLHPVDHPLVDAATIDGVAAALASGATIAVPGDGRRRGHPAGFARRAWGALRAASPERGARAVLADHPEWIVHVAGGPGAFAGIDTREDYVRWVTPYTER